MSIQDRTEHMLRRPPRLHPYENVYYDAQGQYYDFKANPNLIETVLEDFTPHNTMPGRQEFYQLLKHINRPAAPFETTDCGLSQKLYRSPNSPFPDKAGWVGGRVMIIWRELDKNCQNKAIRWLLKQSLRQLRRLELRYHYIGFAIGPFPTVYRATQKRGYQIDFEFAMWGDDFGEAMQRFPEVVGVLDQVIKKCELLYFKHS